MGTILLMWLKVTLKTPTYGWMEVVLIFCTTFLIIRLLQPFSHLIHVITSTNLLKHHDPMSPQIKILLEIISLTEG